MKSFLPLTSITLLLLFALGSCNPTRKVQQTTDLPPTHDTIPSAPGSFPALLVKTENDTASRPLSISEIHLNVEVTGNRATTTMDITFFNPMDRLLEGQWYFPMGEGQTITRFAMDVNGKLREGVAVEKTKARVAYEQTVRQQIDPGLAEWSQGNHFKARVYPIPANGYKRVVLAYQQELPASGEGWLYQLPLNFPEKIKTFSVDVAVLKQEIEPKIDKNELANLFFSRWEEAYRASQTYNDYRPDRKLSFVVPSGKNDYRVWVEGISRDSAMFYFAARVPSMPQMPQAPPLKVCVLWDQSYSAREREIEKEIAFLDQYLTSAGNPEILLVPFHIQPQPVQRFAGTDKAAFLETLRKLPVDGATRFESLNPAQYEADAYIFLSDGISTFGEREFPLPGKPVHTITSGNAVDFPLLRHIARATGGRFVNLSQLSIEQAILTMSTAPLQFISANFNPTEVKALTPSLPCDINKTFSMAGVLLRDQATITLNYGMGGKVLSSQVIQIDRLKDAVKNASLHNFWAAKTLQELDLQPEKNKKQILALGKKYTLLTRETSLLVLDRVEDYVTHEITPPEELSDTYADLLRSKKEAEKFELLSHLDLVAEAFYQRVEWWKKDFAIPEKPYQQQPKREERLLESGSAAFDGDFDDSFGDAGGDFGGGDFDVFEEASPGDAAKPEGEEEEESDEETITGEIVLREWDPDMPYMRRLKETPAPDQYKIYLEMKPEFAVSPAFFLDVADFFQKEGKAELSLLVLSNIAEMELENHELLRVLARRLQQLKLLGEAIYIFEKITEIRPEEPQSWRDLGLAKADKAEYQEAVDLLYKVVSTSWDGRFPEIGVVVAQEMNSVIARSGKTVDISEIDDRLLADMPTDVRVVLDWDADAVDMDLWVTDPRGEKCYYQHKLTEIGGMISSDFTGGYGPEEFLLKKAMKGKYIVQVNYYGTRQQRIAGPTNIQLKLITGYGRKNQQTRQITLRLESESQVIDVGELNFE
ncbi:MAG: VIT domain-containing protein [Bacteroidia bacterium]